MQCRLYIENMTMITRIIQNEQKRFLIYIVENTLIYQDIQNNMGESILLPVIEIYLIDHDIQEWRQQKNSIYIVIYTWLPWYTLNNFLRVRVVLYIEYPTHDLSGYTEKQKRILWMILRAILFWKMACFCPFLHYIAHSSTRGF